VIVSRTADVAGVTVLVAAPVARHGAHPRISGGAGSHLSPQRLRSGSARSSCRSWPEG